MYLDTFLVSTGVEEFTIRESGEKAGEETWTGTIEGFFRPTRMYETYHSKAWGGASMPNAVFFYGGIAFHGTGKVSKLGERDSKGCVRLSRENALKVRTLIQETGKPENMWMAYENVESLEKPGEMLERTRILGTTIDLPAVDKVTGQLLYSQLVPTWDTIVVVLDTSN